MPWLPDDVWEAQRAERAASKGGSDGGKGGKGGKGGGWTQVWKPMFVEKGGWGKGWGKGKGKSLTSFAPDVKVWIGGVAEGATWKELQDHMNQAGKTKWCEVFDKKGAGTGAVAYETAEEASNAIATLNGSVLKGGTLECDVWVKKEPAEAS
eukprot:CAMPEP_0183438996 /NCGR_PEP_ID=MMETSP0370-20130417/77732_1 /TAXON_ID=268820 /ORGANISM="Peridinium aciculiferum, Strain PAER-2" /LENGTH=151 /DNA_ID=CAMNT_0025627341 /DNA_START=39 /DNA_END=494 /DNA_ORIENTATION=-